MVWRKMDLHIHTPGSSDYQNDNVSFIQILQRAEEVGLDILAFTDHNSVRGYARMWREIEDLELLEALGRLESNEARLLSEYRRLLNRILLLPGFEFTATFGFHVLAIFPEDTSIRKLEHTLLALKIPENKLDLGTSEVGATTDVLHAFELLHDAGAIVVGAHVNSTHGIAMQGFPFGGQTKIAYTQSPHLHALESTDLDNPGGRTTARFFNGSKPEYPRRMHVIQGSDAHRLIRDAQREKDLGVGDRVTEILLPELSFAAIKAVFESDDFTRIRPYRATETKFEQALSAREEGNTATQAFHERLGKSRRKTNQIFKDIVALANGEGGAIYVGLDASTSSDVIGVPRAKLMAEQLREDVERFITPVPPVTVDVLGAHDRDVLSVSVASGAEKPYAIASGEIYVREGSETLVANRDQIVELVRRALTSGTAAPPAESAEPAEAESAPVEHVEHEVEPDGLAPRSGVEIVSTEDREGVTYHTMCDLRNLKLVENVTHDSARRLWRYAIRQQESGGPDLSRVKWNGPYGLLRRQKQRDGSYRYDLAYRDDGRVRVFYGVTPSGMADEWRSAIESVSGEVAAAAG